MLTVTVAGMKEILSICVLGTEKNPGNGNNWTRRPSSESSWRGDIIFVYPHYPSIQPSIHPSIGFNAFFASCQHSWRQRRCSVPSLSVTVWTVLSTSPGWWARVRLTRSRRPVGKVSFSFVSRHSFYSSGSQSFPHVWFFFVTLPVFMNIFFSHPDRHCPTIFPSRCCRFWGANYS